MIHGLRTATLVLLTICCCASLADDWPHWMGPERDGRWNGNLISRFPDHGPPVEFRTPIGAGYAGPAIVNNRIFAMDRSTEGQDGTRTENNIGGKGAMPGKERILCLNATSGETLWEHIYDCPYRIAYPNGPRCTPAVASDHVYCLGAMGHLKCLQVENGNVVWERQLIQDYSTRPPLWGYASHPLIDGDRLYVPVGGEGSAVVCFDRTTGKQIWKSSTVKDIGYAPLVLRAPPGGRRQLIFWHSDGVTSLNPDNGEEYWTETFPDAPSPSVVTIATPLFAGNRLIVSDFYVGALVLEVNDDPPAAKVLWKNADNPDQRKTQFNCMMSTPILQGNLLYGVAHNGRGQGVIRCVSQDDGKMLWESDSWADGKKPLLFANGFMARNGDQVFIMTDIGDLLIAKMDDKGFQEIDRTHLLEPTSAARGRDVVWSAPAFANGRMVIRNDKEIISVDLRKPNTPSNPSN